MAWHGGVAWRRGTARGAGRVAFMKQAGMPVAHDAHIVYREVVEERRLVYAHSADFIPGMAPYDVETVVEMEPVPAGVRLALTFDRMHDDVWTERARMGWESELGKLARVLGG
ncbi:MAG: SRPBCC domain-containing protein [bacterium]